MFVLRNMSNYILEHTVTISIMIENVGPSVGGQKLWYQLCVQFVIQLHSAA